MYVYLHINSYLLPISAAFTPNLTATTAARVVVQSAETLDWQPRRDVDCGKVCGECRHQMQKRCVFRHSFGFSVKAA